MTHFLPISGFADDVGDQVQGIGDQIQSVDDRVTAAVNGA